MKTLFYNPIELPAEVHIVSECFGIDITYEPMGDSDHPAWMSELFNLAKCDSFEEVAVRLTKHINIARTGRIQGGAFPIF